ncbi:MAG: class I SAM-dependent methyltransferase [Gammaproteobacteria bacterium]|nr:class I SAM-dependent methyltransferase [Gammaproteobacteria bacterium]
MSRCIDALDRRFYPDSSNNWDDELFRNEILSHVSRSSVVLDVGAGAGIVEQMNFRGLAAKVCGIDLDPRVLENSYLDDAKVTGGESIPYDDDTFDVVFSDNVLEHLGEPEQVFAEVARVLRPGGVFLFKTPNRHHYMPIIARLTPHKFHGFINRLRGRKVVDTFPTLYRANSRRQVIRLADSAGLTAQKLDLIEGRPEYTRIFCPLYIIGILYERLVNRFGFLARFRVLLIGVLSKPSA